MALKSRHEEILESRLEALRKSLATTDRVLSGRDVKLTFNRNLIDQSAPPASSSGDQIVINLDKVPNLGSSSALVHILGLNYHEVGHVRYSIDPSNLISAVQSQHSRFLEAYRIVEEARVETLLAAKYAKMKKYFAYPVIQHFVKDEKTWSMAFLYTHGRRYLPMKIRDTFREIFNKNFRGSAEFSDLIDQYRVLVYTNPQQILIGADLINRFAALMDLHRLPSTKTHDSSARVDFSDEDTEEESRQAVAQAESQERQEQQGEDGSGFSDEEEEEDGEPEGGSGKSEDPGEEPGSGSDDGDQEEPGEESQGPGGGQDQEDGDSEPDSGAGQSPGDSAGDQDEDGGEDPSGSGGAPKEGDPGPSAGSEPLSDSGSVEARGGGAGKGNSVRSRHTPTAEELKEKLEQLQGDMVEALETVLANEDVRNDVDTLRAAMEDQSGLSSVLDRHERNRSDMLMPVTPEMFREADLLKEVLRKIWAQMEPGWNYGLSEGNRLDMSRAALAQDADDYDSIYVDWQEGQQDNAGLEVVIVADESESMIGGVDISGEEKLPPVQRTNKAKLVSRQVWELLYALQEVDAQTTVFAFEDVSRVLHDRTDRVTTNGYVQLTPRGCTDPSEALAEVKRIFTISEMPNKLLICISDGAWDWDVQRPCADILDQIEGAVKVHILVDTSGSAQGFALADKFHVVQRTNGPIFDIMAEATMKLVERNLNR